MPSETAIPCTCSASATTDTLLASLVEFLTVAEKNGLIAEVATLRLAVTPSKSAFTTPDPAAGFEVEVPVAIWTMYFVLLSLVLAALLLPLTTARANDAASVSFTTSSPTY